MPTPLLRDLREVVGNGNVRRGEPERIAYSSDMWPRHQIWKLGGDPCRYPPDAVVWVDNEAQIPAVHRVCARYSAPVIPYGAGSGVVGGAVPLRGGVMLDVKRLNRVLAVDDFDLTVDVEAGMIGMHLEEELNERGYTLGHFPSSILCSTVGGWLAARSAGQYSSKYGKIEDMVVGLRCILPDGTVLDTGPQQDFDWTQVIVGSEGILATITRCTLRIHPKAEAQAFRGFRFRSVKAGMRACRLIMQAGLRPNALRLYDPFDSLLHSSESSSSGRAASLLAPVRDLLGGTISAEKKRGGLGVGLGLALSYPAGLNGLIDRLGASSLLIVGFEGLQAHVDEDMQRAQKLLQAAGGVDGGEGPGSRWFENRYAVSFKQSPVFAAGAFVDTMEVACTWDKLAGMYREVRQSVAPYAFIMAHFSHAYREGCSIYFTFAGYKRGAAGLERLHEKVWEEGLSAVLRSGGSISHHHGVGVSKREHMRREHGAGIHLLYGVKDALDPTGIMNPGKVLPDRAVTR